MSTPWMPLYIADYLADTAHLTAAESGAYLHLIMHYWKHDGLPDDEAQITRIAKMTEKEWARSRHVIAAFFRPGWRHKRIDLELAVFAEKYEARVRAGRKGGRAKAVKHAPSASNASFLLGVCQPFASSKTLAKSYQPQPHPHPSTEGGPVEWSDSTDSSKVTSIYAARAKP